MTKMMQDIFAKEVAQSEICVISKVTIAHSESIQNLTFDKMRYNIFTKDEGELGGA